jgi:hypothetical protein
MPSVLSMLPSMTSLVTKTWNCSPAGRVVVVVLVVVVGASVLVVVVVG